MPYWIDIAAALPTDSLGWFKIALLPIISALIGYLTNVMAVKMIFRPRKPLNILGFKIQGLVPKRQNELAKNIGQTVEKHLISHDDVLRLLNNESTQEEIKNALREKIGSFIDTQLTSINPMFSMFLTGQLREKIESALLREVTLWMPELSERLVGKLESEMDFRAMVEEKVRQFDLDQLESLIFGIAERELKAIEVLGGVLGLLIGIIQAGIMLI